MQAIEHEVRLQLSTENEDVRILLLISCLERHINFKSILGRWKIDRAAEI